MSEAQSIEGLLQEYADAVESAYNHPIAWNRFEAHQLRDKILKRFKALEAQLAAKPLCSSPSKSCKEWAKNG